MNIYVKYFASIRDSMGVDSEDISIDKSLTVFELWEKLSVEKRVSEDILIAVNHEYVDKGFKLNDGDEVAYFPPVTGG